MGIEGKVAVVTGSGRNIGRKSALYLAGMGCRILVNGRTKSKVDEAVDEIKAAGGTALPSYHSIENKEGCDGIIADATKGFGGVDILVNNAAIIGFGYIHEVDEDEWINVINVDLIGAFRLTKRALPFMMERKWGRIINIGSHAGIRGTAVTSSYATAKGGLHTFTKCVAREGGRHGITCNVITPFTRTEDRDPGGEEFAPGAIYKGVSHADYRRDNVDSPVLVPGGRAGPEAVAPVVGFLASEEAFYITGQLLSVGGGMWT